MSFLIRVTGAWTRLLTDWLDRESLDARRLRAAVGAHAVDDAVPMVVWAGMLDEAAALRPDRPALGLDIGAGVAARHVGALGYLVTACDTLGDALVAYQRYERLFYGAGIAQVQPTGANVSLSWPPGGGGALADEVAIAALVSFRRQQVDGEVSPTHVHFMHPASAERKAANERFFDCPVLFAQPRTLVSIPLPLLGLPLSKRDPMLKELLERQAQALLGALPDPNAFDQSVQQVLARLLPEGQVSVDKVAASLHQSTRTLQRRLADSGLLWQELLDRTREQLACGYLHDHGLSLAEIALLLGYSEQSAFTRSFKRWTGLTPRAFRAQAKQGR